MKRIAIAVLAALACGDRRRRAAGRAVLDSKAHRIAPALSNVSRSRGRRRWIACRRNRRAARGGQPRRRRSTCWAPATAHLCVRAAWSPMGRRSRRASVTGNRFTVEPRMEAPPQQAQPSGPRTVRRSSATRRPRSPQSRGRGSASMGGPSLVPPVTSPVNRVPTLGPPMPPSLAVAAAPSLNVSGGKDARRRRRAALMEAARRVRDAYTSRLASPAAATRGKRMAGDAEFRRRRGAQRHRSGRRWTIVITTGQVVRSPRGAPSSSGASAFVNSRPLSTIARRSRARSRHRGTATIQREGSGP